MVTSKCNAAGMGANAVSVRAPKVRFYGQPCYMPLTWQNRKCRTDSIGYAVNYLSSDFGVVKSYVE